MTTDTAFAILRSHGSDECSTQFSFSDLPPRPFDTLRQCLLYLGDAETAEVMPDVHVQATGGDLMISGGDLEHLIAAAKGMRKAS